MDLRYLEEHYSSYDEDGRLSSRRGSVEYLTTMKYIHAYVKPGAKVLEVGAGTGRYSLALSREGYDVTAIELLEHNIDIFRSKLQPGDKITVEQGNALDLGRFAPDSFDAVLLLGPLYHLYSDADKIQALTEARRVMKPDGVLFAAYCMNEAVVIQFAFKGDGSNMLRCLEKHMMTADYHCISKPEDLFEMVRPEEIERLNAASGLRREKIVAADLFTRYLDDRIDAWSEEVFGVYLDYHFAVCERPELLGVTDHALDILRRN